MRPVASRYETRKRDANRALGQSVLVVRLRFQILERVLVLRDVVLRDVFGVACMQCCVLGFV